MIASLLGYLSLGLLTGLTLWGIVRPRPGARGQSRAVFAVLLGLTIIAAHAPVLNLRTALPNPDEAQLLAGALTMRQDFAPWRSVDLSTAGPLSMLPLLVMPGNFPGARWCAALCAAFTVVACWLALTTVRDHPLARIVALPVAAFFVFMQDLEMFQFSTEHVAMVLLAGGAWTWLAATAHGEKLPSCPAALGMGTCLGAAVMAKLQGASCAAWLAAAAGALILLHRPASWSRRAAVFGTLFAGCLIVPACFVILAAAQGVLSDLIQCYGLNNIQYVGAMEQPSRSYEPSVVWGLNYLLKPAGILLLAGLLASRRFSPAERWTALLALGWLAAAIAGIMLPGRNARHYWFFVLGPVLVALGAVVGPAWRAGLAWWPAGAAHQRWAQLGLVAWLLALPVAHRLSTSRDQALAGALGESPTVRNAGEKLRGLAQAGDTLTVWGWQPELHVYSRLPQGTRDACSGWQIKAVSRSDYYRQRYLADLTQNKPRFFVDAVGPGGFAFTDRARAGHEIFAALGELIKTHYTFLGEIDAMRLYVRHAD